MRVVNPVSCVAGCPSTEAMALTAGVFTALLSFAVVFHSQADSFATFENQTEATATIKVLGSERKQVLVKPKGTERLSLKGGEYYFKVRFDLSAGPKYGIGPFFDLLDEPLLKHEVTVPLRSPPLAGLYQISKDQFENESSDTNLVKKANSVPKAWVRWASIVLAVVSEKQEEASRMMFKALAQLEKESTIRDGDYQGFNVGSFQGGTKVSIRDIIKQHGEPTAANRKAISKQSEQ